MLLLPTHIVGISRKFEMAEAVMGDRLEVIIERWGGLGKSTAYHWSVWQGGNRVEMGGPQLEAKKAALAAEASPERASELESEIEQLTEAWGDAHQNLGVLEWVHRGNAAAARPWFEKSIEIWPERPEVRNTYLPQVRGERPRDPDEDIGWAQPCELR